MDWPESIAALLPPLEQVQTTIAAGFRRVLVATLLLGVGWLLAALLRSAVRRGLRRLRSRLPAGAAGAALGAEFEKDSADVLASAVYWFVWLTAILLTIEALGIPALSTWLAGIASHMPRLLVAATIAFAGVVGGRVAGSALQRVVAPMAGPNAARVGRVLQLSVVFVALLVAADQVGLDVTLVTTLLLLVLGSVLLGAGLAFGLGARSVMKNILAMHYVAKTYRVGNVIRVDGDEGRIIRTTPTAVVIESTEGEIEIPGQLFAERRITRIPEGRRAA